MAGSHIAPCYMERRDKTIVIHVSNSELLWIHWNNLHNLGYLLKINLHSLLGFLYRLQHFPNFSWDRPDRHTPGLWMTCPCKKGFQWLIFIKGLLCCSLVTEVAGRKMRSLCHLQDIWLKQILSLVLKIYGGYSGFLS